MSEATRISALKWWRGMGITDQKDLVAKHHPHEHIVLITSSSSKIERMWKKEQA